MHINIAAYHFAHLNNLPTMRENLREFCLAEKLKGTILLSPEGINLFVAGPRETIDRLLALVRSYPELRDLVCKESVSEKQPFSRMLVKIKNEILSFGIPTANPLHQTPTYVKPAELKQWLDDGKDVVLLDTRNEFEVDVGTFKNATHLGIKSFKGIIEAVKPHTDEWKDKTIVTFCTGGIRCEKAAPFMNMMGFSDVRQLEGGILKYFEDCGGAHFNGDCFVFDRRVALNSELKPSGHGICFDCQTVLPSRDVACPKC